MDSNKLIKTYIKKDVETLKKELSPIEYAVTMEDATESPYTGEYWNSLKKVYM